MPLSENQRDRVIAWGLFAAAWICGSFLLWFGGKTLSSPDETAVMVAAQHIAQSYTARVEAPLAMQAGWLHPRSWVSQGMSVVPVGFLGWPWILSVFMLVLGMAITKWLAIGIAASIVPVMYLLLRKNYSRPASLAGTAVVFCYPAFVLYLNRSLFPNPSVLAATLWLTLLLQGEEIKNTKSDQKNLWQKYWRQWVIGLLFGAICVIRPIELFWILPWLVVIIGQSPSAKALFCHFDRPSLARGWRSLAALGLGFLVVLLPVWLVAARTYGAPWRVGYFLRDNVVPSVVSVANTVSSSADTVRFFAFGFHPRNIWWNLLSFGFGFLWPWTLALIGIAGFYLKPWAEVLYKYRRKLGKVLRELAWPDHRFLAAVLGLGLLVLYYGNGLYQDHVRIGAITVGNSFLRYLLPVAALSGWAMAWLYDRVETKQQKQAVLALAVFLGGFGLYRAGFDDDESVSAVIQATRLNDQTRARLSRFWCRAA
ncbi:MAG: hypothetical protein U0487_00215 [Patescibacteria group bacterium]